LIIKSLNLGSPKFKVVKIKLLSDHLLLGNEMEFLFFEAIIRERVKGPPYPDEVEEY